MLFWIKQHTNYGQRERIDRSSYTVSHRCRKRKSNTNATVYPKCLSGKKDNKRMCYLYEGRDLPYD